MIINILSLAAHGKSYLAIKKALEFAVDKRLNCMSWELDNPHMIMRIGACLKYNNINSPVNIHLDQANFSIDKNQLRDMLREKIKHYDVFLLDGVLMLKPNAQEIMNILEKISNEFPEKIFIIPTQTKRTLPSNLLGMTDVHMQLKQQFFEIKPKDNQEFYMVVKQDSKDFVIYDRQEKTSRVLNIEEFTFGLTTIKS